MKILQCWPLRRRNSLSVRRHQLQRDLQLLRKQPHSFLTSEDGERDVFLHVTELEKSKLRKIRENQKIQFEIKEEQGKLKAINLKSKKA